MDKAIEQRVARIMATLPSHVKLVAAAKTRSSEEVIAAIRGGICAIGENYVQEAAAIQEELGKLDTAEVPRVQWHLIGHLQRNKAKKAVELFDMIETIDSLQIAQRVNRHCEALGKTMDVLLEINSGRESNKTGISPDAAEELIQKVALLPNLRIQGLMTMGPRFGNPEMARPYFRLTRELFERLNGMNLKNVEMRYLSMGMSNSYGIAIEEGANIVRIGTSLFGARQED
ncbi:MAG: YggS family pyridoxal phosphate-dependent enzyme [Candidatus Hydrogenedentota bacterium]